MPFSKSKVEKEGEVDRVYRLLKSWILDCRLRPGDFMAEVELARECKTSRTPIREACNRLSQEKWILRIPNKGHVIPPISVREIVEVYEFRKLLECFTADRAAKEASPLDVQRLKQIIEVENQPTLGMAAYLQANEEFHLALAELARNQRLYDHLKLTLEYVHRLDTLSTQGHTYPIPEHREILRALEARNPVEASQAMAVHVEMSRDRMLKLFRS
jgi:GntR family transcriptional regulator, rspAB operon transcriptional repressor